MREVKIVPIKDGDSRVAERVPNISQFEYANKRHVMEVADMLYSIAEEIIDRGKTHDHTKLKDPYKTIFYGDLCETIKGNMSFEEGDWSKLHYEKERHHLNRNCPDDVNLIDVVEMIADCVCAGMARSGEVYPITIPVDVLKRAIDNTVKMCIEAVRVIK